MIKKLLASLGLGDSRSAFWRTEDNRKSPVVMERERFEREVKEQFVKLKEKGLSIPVFTL